MRPRPAAPAVLAAGVLAVAGITAARAAPVCPTVAAEGLSLAVLPLDNRSGEPVPGEELQRAVADGLANCGFDVVPVERLEIVLADHRVRHTGGVSDELAAVLREELGVQGVLVTTLDLWVSGDPPALAMTSRLVETSPTPRILWIDDVSLVGDERPGFLALSIVREVGELTRRAVARLTLSLAETLGRQAQTATTADRRFRPRRAWNQPSPDIQGAEGLRVAVLPFRNESGRRHAGDLVALQMLRHLAQNPRLTLVDPGEVRRVLLQTRLIAEHGVSVPQIELLRATLHADLVISGSVFEYAEGRGTVEPARVNFTGLVFDAREARLVASSLSANTGADGVYFFDYGRSWTAHTLSSRMASRLVHELFKPARKHRS